MGNGVLPVQQVVDTLQNPLGSIIGSFYPLHDTEWNDSPARYFFTLPQTGVQPHDSLFGVNRESLFIKLPMDGSIELPDYLFLIILTHPFPEVRKRYGISFKSQ